MFPQSSLNLVNLNKEKVKKINLNFTKLKWLNLKSHKFYSFNDNLFYKPKFKHIIYYVIIIFRPLTVVISSIIDLRFIHSQTQILKDDT